MDETIMAKNKSFRFPKNILWYAGSGNDFYLSVLPLILREENPELFHSDFLDLRAIDEPLDDKPLVAHPYYFTSFPVVMNDADETLFNQLDGIGAPIVLYENFDVNHYFTSGNRLAWKRLGVAKILLQKRQSIVIDLPVAPPPSNAPQLNSEAPATLFDDIEPKRLRIESADLAQNSIRVKAIELELRIIEQKTEKVLPVWFVLSDVLDFVDTVAPHFESQITGLCMLRTDDGNKVRRKDGVTFSEKIIHHLRAYPERFASLRFAWFDSTVSEAKKSPWRTFAIQDGKIRYRKEHTNNEFNAPEVDEMFLPSFFSIQRWGDSNSQHAQLYVPAHNYRNKLLGRDEVETFWIVTGLLLAGAYPSGQTKDQTYQLMSKCFDMGIRTFINLVPDEELVDNQFVQPYRDIAQFIAKKNTIKVKFKDFPIQSKSTVINESGELNELISFINKEIKNGRCVYVHGNDGVIRATMLIGLWLKRQRNVSVSASPIALLNMLNYLASNQQRYEQPELVEHFEFLNPKRRDGLLMR
jgi:protein-tyrosine phosphatase